MKRLLCIVAIFIMALNMVGCNSQEEEISKTTVFVDSSLETALNAVLEEYNKETPSNVEIVSGSTSSLYNRIVKGAECDIFIPSSKEQINSLVQAEYLNEKNVTPILYNNMVLIKSYDKELGIKTFDSVTEANSIALANEGEPAGLFAREIFINLNVFKQVLNMKINSCDNSPAVVENIINGKSDVGVCFETDAMANADKVQVIASAPKDSLNSEILYSVAVLNREDGLEPSDSVKAFAEYLDTPEAADIFDDYDFGIYIEG